MSASDWLWSARFQGIDEEGDHEVDVKARGKRRKKVGVPPREARMTYE